METLTQNNLETTEPKYIDNFETLDLSKLKRFNMSKEETKKLNIQAQKDYENGIYKTIDDANEMLKKYEKYM